MKKYILKFLSVSLSAIFPLIALAQVNTVPQPCIVLTTSMTNVTDFCGLASYVIGLLQNAVIPLLMTLAVAFFVWGVTQYVLNPASSEEREKGQQYMIWGILGLFVIVAVWGLVAILTNTFGIQVLIPQLQQ